jgi:hypothetical protein
MRKSRDFITVRQAADMIGALPVTLCNWDRSARLKATRHRVNRYSLYRRQDVQSLLAVLTDSPPAKEAAGMKSQSRLAKDRL